jgi:hypothetical protein
MRHPLLSIAALLAAANAFAQKPDLSKVSSKNTWVKAGINAGAPLQPTNSTFILGLDASVQFLETKASGIGIKSGISNYFAEDKNAKDLVEIPLAIMYRYYPTSTGFFSGLDVGYSFLLNAPNTKGGFMGRPHIGYHSNNWNIFAYANLILTEDANNESITSIGLSFTRNFRFKKKK